MALPKRLAGTSDRSLASVAGSASASALRSVSMTPGEMELAVMPSAA